MSIETIIGEIADIKVEKNPDHSIWEYRFKLEIGEHDAGGYGRVINLSYPPNKNLNPDFYKDLSGVKGLEDKLKELGLDVDLVGIYKSAGPYNINPENWWNWYDGVRLLEKIADEKYENFAKEVKKITRDLIGKKVKVIIGKHGFIEDICPFENLPEKN